MPDSVQHQPATVRQRRRFIVEGFQTAFLLTLVVWVAGWLVVLAAGVLAPAIVPMLAGRPEHADPAVADALLSLHDSGSLPLAGSSSSASPPVLVRETHRVAGPLYRFRQVFRTIASGDLSLRVRVRDGDYLTQEADELDRMVVALRDCVSHMQHSIDRVAAAVEALDREGLLPTDTTHALRESITNARLKRMRSARRPPPPIMGGLTSQSAATRASRSSNCFWS